MRAYPDIPIITIGYGLEDQDGLRALQEMSAVTGGSHIALSMDEITQLYREVADQLVW